MTLEQAAYLADIVGVILIVVSLVYLAKQLRQNNELMASAARSTAAALSAESYSAFIDNPDIVTVLLKDRRHESLTPDEEFRINAVWMRALINWAYIYQEGHYTNQEFAGLKRAFAAYGSLRRTWQGGGPGSVAAGKDNFNPGFVAFVEAELLTELSS